MGRTEEAYLYLKDAIMSNRLLPGKPISELAVAGELKMSRSPIREALRRLETEGLVVSYPSRGAFVSSLSPYDVEEIYDLRMLLELWAVERSIQHIPEAVLDELETLFVQTAGGGDWETRHLADRKLHGAIIEAAGSKRLLEFTDMLNTQIERIRRVSAMDQNRSRHSYDEHMEILKYLKKRDLEHAKEALSRHLRNVADSAAEMMRFSVGKDWTAG